MSKDNNKLNSEEQLKVAGGRNGLECQGLVCAPLCPNCGKKLPFPPPPPHHHGPHHGHGPHGPKPHFEGEPKLNPPDVSGNDGK